MATLQGKSEKTIAARRQWQERKRKKAIENFKASCYPLLAELGYEHMTIARIAERAGFSEMSFFRYFSSKEAYVVESLLSEKLVLAFSHAAISRWECDSIVDLGLNSVKDVAKEPWTNEFSHLALLLSLISNHPELRGPLYQRRNDIAVAANTQLGSEDSRLPQAAKRAAEFITAELIFVALVQWAAATDYKNPDLDKLASIGNDIQVGLHYLESRSASEYSEASAGYATTAAGSPLSSDRSLV